LTVYLPAGQEKILVSAIFITFGILWFSPVSRIYLSEQSYVKMGIGSVLVEGTLKLVAKR
jgi:hypothetical protein